MKLIPVIDLKNSIVVHAKQGQRDQYQPIKSVLTPNFDIYSVLHGFLNLYAFDTFYIADLNAITGQGDNTEIIYQVLSDFPEIIFWVDAGYQQVKSFPKNYFPVLGSECFNNENICELLAFEQRFVLSLDYGANGEMLGAEKLFTETNYWSENVIVMTLNRVGSSRGVNIESLQHFKQNHPRKNFIAAGGVRGMEDMLQLKNIDVNHVLLASAFHSGAITTADIAKI